MQARPSDCGYVCISAALSLFKRRITVAEIKQRGGDTTRGLTLRQLRDVIGSCGGDATAIKFDPARPESYPVPAVILLREGHYVVVARRQKKRLEVFYPEAGWRWVQAETLAKKANGFGVHISSASSQASPGEVYPADKMRGGLLGQIAKRFIRSRATIAIVGLGIVAQAATLLVPLLSMKSVDRFQIGAGAGYAGTVGLAFLLISLTSSLTSLLSGILNRTLFRGVSAQVANEVFDLVAAKPALWFEGMPPDAMRNAVASVDNLVRFAGDILSAAGEIILSVVIGLAALWFISPWLMLPGFLFFVANTAIDLWWTSAQAQALSTVVDTLQRRNSFVLDVVSQIPLLQRLGNLRKGRGRYARLVRQASAAEGTLQNVQNYSLLLTSGLKSFESLAFVSVAAFFMGSGHYTLGAFVAVGAYKDLLSQALVKSFQLYAKYKTLRVYLHQAAEVVGGPPVRYRRRRRIERGGIELRQVTFRYSSFDEPVLRQANLVVRPAEFVILAGPSGAGKSTLAKVICGLAVPESGEVLIDGLPVTLPMEGMGSVLQSDRLIAGSIRENVTLFRSGLSDEDILTALEAAELGSFIRSLPMRLDTMVGEGLTGLSGGQRQRLLLARALAGSPGLLLLDEATSSLDVETEAKILDNLRRTGATVVLVAHRPEVWRYANSVYDVHSGGIHRRQPCTEAARFVHQSPSQVASMSENQESL